jgi:hypothetical protein
LGILKIRLATTFRIAAVERIRDGTITGYVYDPKAAALVHAEKA